MRNKIIPIVLASLLLISSIAYPIYAVSTEELQEQQNELRAKANEVKQEQEQVKQELSETMREISALDASISSLQEEIDNLNLQITALEESIDQKQKEIEEKQAQFEKNKKLMEDRLVIMYETGETTFLDMLFNSKSIMDFISNYYTLSQMTQCDAELLDRIDKEKKEIEEAKQQLEEDKEELDSAKSERVEKSNTLKSQKSERQVKANALSAEEKSLQSEIDDYNASISRIESQIREALRDAEGSADGLNFDGSFIWPCDNRIITSGVKQRWGRWHKGIDIGARYENVYASASGYCYPLENPGGYGHYILMVHGDGWCSLYGHLNSYNVSYGEYVSQGEVIAQSGNSGSSTGPHLHFELRRATSVSNYFSTSFLNPLDYLPGGWSAQSGAFTAS